MKGEMGSGGPQATTPKARCEEDPGLTLNQDPRPREAEIGSRTGSAYESRWPRKHRHAGFSLIYNVPD
jgi:hypothetical protein